MTQRENYLQRQKTVGEKITVRKDDRDGRLQGLKMTKKEDDRAGR